MKRRAFIAGIAGVLAAPLECLRGSDKVYFKGQEVVMVPRMDEHPTWRNYTYEYHLSEEQIAKDAEMMRHLWRKVNKQPPIKLDKSRGSGNNS